MELILFMYAPAAEPAGPGNLTELNVAGDPAKGQDQIRYRDAKIQVLDQELKVVASRLLSRVSAQPAPAQVRVTDVDGDGLNEILLLSDRLEVLKVK